MYPDNLPIIGSISKQPTIVNFEVGDRIISVNGIMTESWVDLFNIYR